MSHQGGRLFPLPANCSKPTPHKGELYFQNMEVTGSTDGIAREPKYSLLQHFCEKEIPALESIIQQLSANNPNHQIIVHYQMDGAGPHTDTKLKVCLADEFASRGWHLVNQSPNSPLTNVHDDYVFPSMSKLVLAAQGLNHGSHVLETEHL